MRSYLTLLGCLCLASQYQAILLCDGDCAGRTDLEICLKLPKNKTQLNIMAFFPCNTEGFRARGLTVAGQMAAKEVANSKLLPDYSLKLIVDNTMCNQLAGIRAFINQLATVQQTSEQRYMILGPGCSVGAATTAQVAPFYSLTQIGYTTTGVSLSDQRLYPNFLRSISSDNASVSTVTALVQEFGWRQIAIISVRDELFRNLTAVQINALGQAGVNVQSEQFAFDSNSESPELLEAIMDKLNRSGARIVLLNIYENTARQIFCIAYQQGMTFPKYTYISHYWYSEFWWTDRVNETNCTKQELTDAIRMSLAVDHFPSPPADKRNATTDVNYTPNEFWKEFERNILTLNYSRSEALRQAAYVYDAVWMAAFALHNASIELKNGAVEGANSLAQFNHFADSTLTSEINALILRAARNSEFQGVSGRVKLNALGDREPSRQVYQYTYTEVIDPNADNITPIAPFGFMNDAEVLLFAPGFSSVAVFPDGPTRDVVEITINVVLFSVYTVLAILGVGFAVVCFVFSMVFRNKRIVKLSSPYLNLLIILGAILFYVAAIVFGLDTGFAPREVVDIVRCQFAVWLVSIGFSLLFGTMLAKTWRVYYIFKNIKLNKRPLKDWVLFLIVMVMVGVDIVFLIIVSVDLFRVKLTAQPLIPQPNGQLPHFMEVCESDASIIWIPILLVYKAFYLIVGVFLAVQTYNVKIKRLRDSKLIVACVCIIGVAALVGGIVGVTVEEPTTAYGIYGFFILTVVTAILFILFGTLMIELAKNPSGEVEVSTVAGAENTSNLDSIKPSDQLKISELKQTIQTLKGEIEEKKRLTVSSENILSPDHSNAGSRTNLLRDHVTPNPKAGHMTDHVIPNPEAGHMTDHVIDSPEPANANGVEVQCATMSFASPDLQDRPTEESSHVDNDL